METVEELLDGCFRLSLKRLTDARGEFVKTFARSAFSRLGIHFEMCEEFYSVSHAGVIRGMHFQLPPHAHAKVVYCAVGAVEDVLLDLRAGGDYGRVASVELNAESPSLLVVPAGVAHGFNALRDLSVMVYKTSTEHAPSHDAGILWNSFGHVWKTSQPVLSERDTRHPSLADFQTPFL